VFVGAVKRIISANFQIFLNIFLSGVFYISHVMTTRNKKQNCFTCEMLVTFCLFCCSENLSRKPALEHSKKTSQILAA